MNTTDAVKEYAIRAVDGSKTTAEGFKAIGLNADEMSKKMSEGGDSAEKAFMATVAAITSMEDPLKQQQAGVALFGTQWEDVQKDVIGALDPTVDMLGEVAGATDKAGQALKANFSDRAKKDLRELGAALQPLGDVLLDVVEPALEGASEHIKTFTEWLNGLSPTGKKTVVAILGITAALGPLLIGLGFAAQGVGAITKALSTGVGAFGKYVFAAKGADVVLDSLGNSADKTGKKLNDVDGKVGKTSKGLGALKGGAGLAAGSFLSLGSGAGILSGALAFLTGPIGLTALAIGATVGAGTLLYKNWDKIQESSPGLKAALMTVVPGLYGIVGGIKSVQSMSDQALPSIENFGKKVSESTAKSVLGYKKLNDEATVELNKLMFSGQTITQQMSDNITGIFGRMGEQISTSLKADYDKSYGFMSEYFTKSKALSEAEEATILANTQTRYNRQVETVQLQEAKIKEIMDLASKEKRTLTQEEKNQINQIQLNMMTTAVQTMSKSEVEQKVIMERLKNESANITAQQAATTVANSLKAKNGVVKEANDKYNKTVSAIIRERDETGSISAEQANKLIAEAERQKNESVKKATEMHNNVVDQAKAQAKGHVGQVDWTTGQVKTKWELLVEAAARYVNDVSDSINWVLDKLDVDFHIPKWTPKTVSSGSSKNPNRTNMGNQAQYAKGTPSTGHPGGPAIVSERGRELIHEPGIGTYLSGSNGPEMRNLRRGTSVLPNKHTERLLKNYGFPGYEDGTGSFFDWALKGPKFLLDKALEQFGVSSFPSMGGVFDKIGGGIASTIKGHGETFLQGKLDSLFSSFGGGNDKDPFQVGVGSGFGGMMKYVEHWYNMVKDRFGSTNFMGAYNNRNVRGGSSKSMHAYGRAFDIGGSHATMSKIAEFLRTSAKDIQHVIYNRRISSFGGAWRGYNGVNPHTDHVHADFKGISMPADQAHDGGGSGVQRWSGIASRALQMTGQFTKDNLRKLLYQMKTESNGNPSAINNWDSNAKKGTPSKGLMQVIDPTFRAYAHPSFNKNIYDPLSNILASIRYSLSRYGSLSKSWRGVGYAKGDRISSPTVAAFAENGYPEYAITTEPRYRNRSLGLWSSLGQELGVPMIPSVPSIDNVSSHSNGAQNLVSMLVDKVNNLLTNINIQTSNVYLDDQLVGEITFRTVDSNQVSALSWENSLRGMKG